MKNFNIYLSKFFTLFLLSFVFVACDDDNEGEDVNIVTPPATYSFERNGSSTVSFSGQTTRLNQSDELYGALNSTDVTVSALNLMFAGDGGSSAGFTNPDLNGTSKLIRSKTSASTLRGSAATQALFDAWISEYVLSLIHI